MKRRARWLGLTALGLAGCAIPATPPPPLAGIPVHSLAVSSIDVAEAFPPLASGTFIDQRHTRELTAAARDYLATRLKAVGGGVTAQASIVRASMVQEPRAPSGRLGAPIVREPDADLHGTIEVRLGLADGTGKELGFASARVERTRSILELTSVVERDRMAGEMVRQLMVDLDRALDQSMRENLAAFLPPAG